MKKSWKWTRSHQVDAQVAGEVIENLPERSPEYLIREARKKSSPLHSLFEWDNTAAAKEYRLLQARLIINSLECEIISSGVKPKFVKAFIKKAGSSGQYIEIEKATDNDLSDAEAECLRHMNRFKSRWSGLELARNVIAEIQAVRVSTARKRKKVA